MPNTSGLAASSANAGGGAMSPSSIVSVELTHTDEMSDTLIARTRAT